MDCPFTVSAAEWSPPLIDRITFPHPDGTQTVYLLATPEREAAGELLMACRKTHFFLDEIADAVTAAGSRQTVEIFRAILDDAIAKAQRRTP